MIDTIFCIHELYYKKYINTEKYYMCIASHTSPIDAYKKSNSLQRLLVQILLNQ